MTTTNADRGRSTRLTLVFLGLGALLTYFGVFRARCTVDFDLLHGHCLFVTEVRRFPIYHLHYKDSQ